MNYKERMTKLRALKQSLGDVDDTVSTISSDVGDWTGGMSKNKYITYIDLVKTDTTNLLNSKGSIVEQINKIIQTIQRKFDQEYMVGKMMLSSIEEKDKKLQKINEMTFDESVKDKLKLSIS